jgi:hypothetical protein
VTDSNFIRPELAQQMRDVFRAIDAVLLAAPTLHHALKPGHVPFGSFEDGRWQATPLVDGLHRYGNALPFAIWQMLRAVEQLRIGFAGKPSAALDLPPAEPDEAPGLALPEPEPTSGEQQRLAVTTGDD